MGKRPKSKAGATDPGAADRRRSARFKVFLRADYSVGDHRTFSYSSNLSAGGLMLSGATRLEVGAALASEAHAQAEKELAVRRRELEGELEARSKAAEKTLAEERNELRAGRTALDRASDELAEREAQLGRQLKKLEQGQAKLEEEREALLGHAEDQKKAAASAAASVREREREAAAKLAGVAAEEQAAADRLKARERELAAEAKELARQRAELGEAGKLQASLEKVRADATQLRREAVAPRSASRSDGTRGAPRRRSPPPARPARQTADDLFDAAFEQ